MNSNQKNNPSLQDGPKPSTGFTAVPLWFFLMFAGLFYWGALFLDEHAGGYQESVYEPYHSYDEVVKAQPVSNEGAFIAKGKQVFDKTCSLCHQPNGMGKEGTAPPLAGSDWVANVGPNRIGRIVLDGLSGPIKVSGKDYNLAMVSWKATLSDADIAAALSYVRSQWGNKGSLIKTEQIKALRAENKDRDIPWTAEDLLKLPDK